MSWWKRLWHGGGERSSPERLRVVRLTMQGWSEGTSSGGLRIWRDPQGDVLSLAIPDGFLDLPPLSDETGLQQWSRSLAESRAAGLIEVRVTTAALGAAVGLMYKRLEKSAYIFTGMLLVPSQSHVWTVVAGERGTTGVREAVVTAELMNAGKLTIQDYERSWAHDPYDPGYRRVDRSVLRFISDDECYDERFPEHPLSKVRQVLATLPSSVQVESSDTGTNEREISRRDAASRPQCPMTAEDFRRLALSLPEASEQSHMGHPDFRVRGKIFATLGHPDDTYAMVKLLDEQQDVLVRARPDVFAPVPGGWGKRGATYVTLHAADEAILYDVLVMAWRNTAPKSLLKLHFQDP